MIKNPEKVWLYGKNFLPLHSLLSTKLVFPSKRRDGRVVDYNGLENRRAERHRGFESLSLRQGSERRHSNKGSKSL